jgi:putative addiction module component (TIGR02574 family)
MTATFDTVLQDALRLPVEERSRMASRLIESVDDGDEVELSPAWRAEINRRVESILDGTAKLIEHEEVMTGVRQKLAQQRAAKHT